MKIGIAYNPCGSGYSRFVKNVFSKIAWHGFLAVDYDMENTQDELYELNGADLEAKMHEIKAEAEQANLEISQVHGP